MTTENPTFKVGEKVYLSYAIRGFTPDANGNATISHKITLSGVELPLCEVKHESFKINSEITSYGPPKPDELVFSREQVGEGVLTLLVVDEVAEETLIKEYPYQVTP